MHYLPKIFSQSAWQILGKITSSLSTFIILGLVARNYGKEGTGVFTLTLTYLAVFYLLADFGFNAHVLKKIKNQTPLRGPEIKTEWQKLLGTRIIWSGILVILAIITLPFWPFTSLIFSQAVIFGSLAIVGSSIFVTCNLIFQSKLRYDLSVLASSFGSLVSLAIFAVFLLYKPPISFMLLAHMLGWIVIGFIGLILVRKFFLTITPIFDKPYTVNLLKNSWPIAATLALNVIYFRADSFMIAYYRNVSEVGIYNVAYSLFQSALVLPTFVMNSYYPLMLKSLSAVRFIGAGLLGLSLVGTVTTLVLAPLVINILTGGGFSGSVESLQILSLSFPAFFLSSFLMWILITKGKYKTMLLLYTSTMIFNLILNFIYIPKYSYFAASWTTVISEYLVLLLQVMVLWLDRKK